MRPRPTYPARFPHFFAAPFASPSSSSSRSKIAWMTRQTAYAANPRASRARTTFPHDSSAMVARAPLRLVAFPPWPSATPIASTATRPYETPFATRPQRATPAYQPLPVSAFACVLFSLRRATSSPRPTVDTVPPRFTLVQLNGTDQAGDTQRRRRVPAFASLQVFAEFGLLKKTR